MRKEFIEAMKACEAHGLRTAANKLRESAGKIDELTMRVAELENTDTRWKQTDNNSWRTTFLGDFIIVIDYKHDSDYNISLFLAGCRQIYSIILCANSLDEIKKKAIEKIYQLLVDDLPRLIQLRVDLKYVLPQDIKSINSTNEEKYCPECFASYPNHFCGCSSLEHI